MTPLFMMPTIPQSKDDLIVPFNFFTLFNKSLEIFKRFFVGYMTLSVLTYLPFALISLVSSYDLMDIVELFHGNLLDIVIFLTLPTLALNKRVYPTATLVLFQRFFTSAILIVLVQIATLFFFTLFFARISIGLFILGLAPYSFILFAGHWLILENKDQLIVVKSNILSSVALVRIKFFAVFWSFINVSLLLMVPMFIFSFWYFGRHADMIALVGMMDNKAIQQEVADKIISILSSIAKEPGFQWGRASLHLLFRPIKSIFLSLLFINLLTQVFPNRAMAYLGIADVARQPNAPGEANTENDA